MSTQKKKASRRRARPKRPTIHQLKVTLRGAKPPIWRRLLVPSSVDLGMLHTILQTVMDWSNVHLHQFEVDGKRISDPAFELDAYQDDDERTLYENAVELRDIAPNANDRFVYTYDFGDDWVHDIVVEEVRDFGDDDTPLWCLDGARACPPDDVGGMGGYEQLLEVLRDKKHSEHKQMMAWAGGPIDPEAFDCRAVNRELTRWVLSQE